LSLKVLVLMCAAGPVGAFAFFAASSALRLLNMASTPACLAGLAILLLMVSVIVAGLIHFGTNLYNRYKGENS